MGGDMEGWYFPSLDGGSRTLVIMGRTGNGKSATGNSILGEKAFESRSSMSSVTSTAECLTTTIANGQVVNVIDTPGLFDASVGSEFISKEIVKCIDLGKDGIHAILLVLSVQVRFTEEETAAIKSLQTIFGPKITDYMIVVFTGGDTLEKDQSLEKFLSQGCPDSLQKIVDACKKRMLLFDNKTEDDKKKAWQLQKLLSLVDKVIEENDGQPYTNILISKMREGAMKHRQQKEELSVGLNGRTEQEITNLMEKLQKAYDEQLKRMMEMVECKLMETNEKLQQQLAEEKAARLNAEKVAEDAQKQSEEDIQLLRKKLAKAKKKSEDEIQVIQQLKLLVARGENTTKDAKADKTAQAASTCVIL